jgi:hypothetical protein
MGLFGAIVAQFWRSEYWLRPNRYWLLGAIIVGIIVLDRREVQRRRRAAATLPYVCQHRG